VNVCPNLEPDRKLMAPGIERFHLLYFDSSAGGASNVGLVVCERLESAEGSAFPTVDQTKTSSFHRVIVLCCEAVAELIFVKV
jgi:hypothetical protein